MTTFVNLDRAHVERPKRLTRRQRENIAKTEAMEAQANAILKAISGNQCLPSKRELKEMVNSNQWDKLGELFHFTPEFIGNFIDWRCVPDTLTKILQSPAYRGDRVTFKTSRSNKVLQGKTESRFGKRELLYCEQSGVCHYCGQHIVFVRWTVDHKFPLVRGGTNHAGNIVGCCGTCNGAKGALSYDEFMATEYMGGSLNLKEEIKRVSFILRSLK